MNISYVCDDCGGQVTFGGSTNPAGRGLKTATCWAHPFRFVTVMRDLSGGKEADKGNRSVPVRVRRHTKVRVVRSHG